MASASVSSTLGPLSSLTLRHTKERSKRMHASDPERAERHVGKKIDGVDGRLSMRREDYSDSISMTFRILRPAIMDFWTQGLYHLRKGILDSCVI